MAGVAVVNAVVFGVYGNFQRYSPQPDALSSHFLAGAAAGFVQSFVCCPMELVKTRLQVQQHSAAPGGGYGGPMNCLSQVTSLLLLLLLSNLYALPWFVFGFSPFSLFEREDLRTHLVVCVSVPPLPMFLGNGSVNTFQRQ
jgi:hypothetical protein